MTAENSFNKSLLFVWSANGWEDQNMDSSFSSQTLIWRRHCSIGQSCSSMLSKWSSNWFLVSSLGMKFFHPSICLTNQKPCTFLSIIFNETNQIALFACICCFCFVRMFSFQGHTKIALFISKQIILMWICFLLHVKYHMGRRKM